MKNNFYKISSFLLAITFLSSCLKDDSLVLDPEKGVNVIEFGNTTDIAVHGSKIPAYVHSYDISTTPTTLNIPVQYSGPEATAPQDITVTLAIGANSVLTAYNADQGTAYEMLPAATYTIPTLQVVIPKGQSKATIAVQFKTNLFDLTKNYALPLTIASSSFGTVSGNFGTAVYAVGAKNKYDGVYTATGSVTDRAPTATANYMGYYPHTVQFRTVDESTIDIYSEDFGGYYYIFINQVNGGAANFGHTRVKFDVATNQVISILTNTNAQKGILVTAPGSNVWTAAPTKSVELNWTSTGAARYAIKDKYVYVGPR